ncbi:Cleavage stimulation factor subunit 2 [Neolecta irregularis DAH-3]|uniref:Cleavage stimulation factor subunit 2 n=1 Tax=Neolecta irregularis (strain DAH-3) TaxID=1198029 RepID=A0A1U7LI82_NEOID|nr:Cleavage stimulation factor subunit 2 [Neolecta irregularis DAH-3]|eukprot:OLL22370.1 Cleavage stimulation factor subunit 2 [Neolecta irregularis DAH-3]
MSRLKVVFVGNIPYDLTEQQLTDIFNEVGPVANFRLLFDRDTGKGKGYGFCEYHDPETAASAVRNLNNYDINGRQLRVDYADNETAKSAREAPQQKQPQLQQPPGTAPNPGETAMDAIKRTLSSFSPPQLIEIIAQLKQIAMVSPDQASQFLCTNPQLAYAVFQALLMMNLVHPNVLQSVVKSVGQTSQQPPQQPVQQQQQAQPAALPQLSREVVTQIMGLKEEQIASLGAAQQAQISELKKMILSGNFQLVG